MTYIHYPDYLWVSLQLFRHRLRAIKSHHILYSETKREIDDVKVSTVQYADKLLAQYGNSILRLAYSYVHNMSDSEDILQDTLIQFIKADPAFNSPSQEKAWLMRVAANLSKNKITYGHIHTYDELSEDLQSHPHDELSFVWDAVKELPVKYREVIHLYYYEGYSIDELSHILDKNVSTIKSLLHRGRKQLKKILEEAYDFD